MKFILGKKIGMTQIFNKEGKVEPITLVEAGPATVTQVLTNEKNGYSSVQLGYGRKKLNSPQRGHLKDFVDKKGSGFAYLKEFRIDDESKFKKGDILDVAQFEMGERVSASAVMKGKGFQGVVKRWNFKGGPKTHGQKHTLRTPGSIGSAFPQRVFKGLKMAGRMGGKRKTVKNLKVVYIDKERNMVGLRGAVPGNTGSFVEVVKNGK
ncbi:MAG: 50S ribosomal protein L3 [Candidatus Spechtbacteria bacterium RIFCSPLOWO2_01_FULL_43_12]|uniref:Large ribosomal subunit protein uL3 n=1 Tax=Candidatus Spechtbacteria bacterium RIFCSPLOWO2_01_FULL_43_12 TaxID=1802162 RepID=A0A1G2HDN3_9BACT|nr:MAG: 50S ribosomal protein L3 [Candidatus Spechtbacteria bacterium RIFCSPLOWO2_01_FULL_43_12]